jgi:hypothetical protein
MLDRLSDAAASWQTAAEEVSAVPSVLASEAADRWPAVAATCG